MRIPLVLTLLILSLPGAGLSALAAGPAARGPETADSGQGHRQDLQLEELVAEALANNPALAAAKARWRVTAATVPQAASLDDPTLSLVLNNYPVDSFADGRSAMTGKVVKLSQKFPYPGKLAAKAEAARAAARWQKAVYEDRRLRLASQVREAYYRLYWTDRTIEIVERNAALLRDVIQLTETNYAVGKGAQQDVLQAQVKHSQLTDRLIGLRAKRATLLARLNTLVGRAPETAVSTPAELDLPPVTPEPEKLLAAARRNRPLYAGYLAQIKKFEAKRRLARLNGKPNFSLSLAYTFREANPVDRGTDFASIGFGMTLPIYRARREAEKAEAQAALSQARHQLAAFEDQLSEAIQTSWLDLDRNRSQALLYKEGLIPQASMSFEASLSAYRVGKTTLLTLLDNLMALNRHEIGFHRAVAEALAAYARLAATVGGDPALGTTRTGGNTL